MKTASLLACFKCSLHSFLASAMILSTAAFAADGELDTTCLGATDNVYGGALPSDDKATVHGGSQGDTAYRAAYSEAVTGVAPIGGRSIAGTITGLTPLSTGFYDAAVNVTGSSRAFRLRVID